MQRPKDGSGLLGGRGLLLVCMTAAAGCGRTMLVALPSKSVDWVTDFGAKASEHHVTIEAHLRAWRGEPREIVDRATPVLVRFENLGTTPIRLSRTSFELVSGTARFQAIAPERIGTPPVRLIAEELPESTVHPGESSSGFVYFPRITGFWGFVHLRTILVSESHAVLGSVDLPFGSGHDQRCSLAYVDERELHPPTSILFRTCLPPFR